MTAAVIRQSWFKTLALRVPMCALFIAWKGYEVEQAGNLFVFILWFMSVISVLVIFVTPSTPMPVPSPSQKKVGIAFVVCMAMACAWFGHFGLAVLFLLVSTAGQICAAKYDTNGLPLAKTGGSA